MSLPSLNMTEIGRRLTRYSKLFAVECRSLSDLWKVRAAAFDGSERSLKTSLVSVIKKREAFNFHPIHTEFFLSYNYLPNIKEF